MIDANKLPQAPRGRSPGRQDLQPGQHSELVVADRQGHRRTVILQTDRLIEAPNWTPDGRWLVVNSAGKLFRIAPAGGQLEEIYTGALQNCNNDHVISPDGRRIYVSADGHLYGLPLEGGEPVRVSNLHPNTDGYRFLYYLHGISPDGQQLVYVSVEPWGGDPRGRRNIWTIAASGGPDVRLINSLAPADGPEYTPDGQWIWFNWEQGGSGPGHAQLFRMRPDGRDVQRMTTDENVNWFPHISPDGKWVIYLAYAPGTLGHPADVDLRIRVVPAAGGELRDVISFFGGQGSLNVNSWAPDSERFAYVAYPIA